GPFLLALGGGLSWGRRPDNGSPDGSHIPSLFLGNSLDNAILHPLQPLIQHSHIIRPWRRFPGGNLVDAGNARSRAMLACWLLPRAPDFLPSARNTSQR